jgi:hypothetical protein
MRRVDTWNDGSQVPRARRPSGRLIGVLAAIAALAVLALAASLILGNLGVIAQLGGLTAPDSLAVGDCFTGGAGERVLLVVRDSCGRPHDGEVAAVFDWPTGLGDDAYPGDDRAFRYGERRCMQAADGYVGGRLGTRFAIRVIYPNATAWSRGDRHFTCAIVAADGSPLALPVRDLPSIEPNTRTG